MYERVNGLFAGDGSDISSWDCYSAAESGRSAMS